MEQTAQAIAERIISLVMDSIDIDAIVARVDIQKIIERVDINAIVAQLDIDALVQQTELGSIIAHSTTGVLSEVLDVVRSQGVGIDDFVFRWANRVVGRRAKASAFPTGPALLVAGEETT
jgi:poly(A) polymerase Pap1